MAVRVGVADDSFLIREALTRLLGDADEIEPVAVCADGEELPAAVDLKHRLQSRAQLLATIETVAQGGSVIDAKVVEALVHARSRQVRSPLDVLTPREREILVEMARGASNAAIAEALGLTKRAVEKHINSVFAKLDLPLSGDVSRRVRAVLLFLGDTGRVVPTLDTT